MIYKSILLLIMIFSFSCASYQEGRIIITQKSNDTFLKESLNRRPASELKKIASSHSLCLQGEISLALKNLKKQIDVRKNDHSYWEELGFCYFKNEEFQKSILFYEISLSKTSIKSFHSKVINNLSLVYLKLGKLEKSHHLFKQSLKLNEKNLSARYNLARLYFSTNQYRLAQKEFNKLYRLNKNDPQLRYFLAKINLKHGKVDKALNLLKGIQENQYTSKIVLAIAQVLYLKNQVQDADKLLEKHNIAVEKVTVNAKTQIRAI